ncbi:hypothetical protein CONLIGDRAFT_594154 [Coniochaeta ligniaria NRRL 30616]|uniref:Mucoidy inhibitor-like protein n=1 Tax=Coniochaeta ligniaria NRRL 30616 TaxID=1408157 RepID=A0A1J7JY76_9PEZI|nr:hypothetical protein CONLIGDRAFT_594154 [Coniochaeta ligniaria NRRL 30616]
MDTIPKQEFRVRDLSTRTVTLFPTRAQVVRDIKDVVLKPGANEITILGLSPSVDEDSIKVEGTGSAIISDIAVELLPNRDIFEDIYPESDNDTSDDDLDTEDDEVLKKESEALASVREELTSMRDEQKRAKEIISSAECQLKILDAYGKNLDRKRSVDIGAGLDAYRVEREKVFKDHMDATIRDRKISKDIADLVVKEARLAKIDSRKQRQADKTKVKTQKAKTREAEKRQRREAEIRKEKRRIQNERESFWPRSCWSVRITLDAVNITDTPGSSRRSSIASASELVKVAPEKRTTSQDSDTTSYTCDLSLSYVVSSAYWSPSYDLSLSTTSSTALLCFDAQLTNKTSENWSNCKIVLSTSQATFAGLQDAIPTLVPWRVRLGGRGYGAKSSILDSREERAEKDGYKSQQNAWGAQKSRAHLYGRHAFAVPCSALPGPPIDAAVLEQYRRQMGEAQGSFSDTRATSAAPGAAQSTFGGNRGGGGLFGSASSNNVHLAPATSGLFGATSSVSIQQQEAAQTAPTSARAFSSNAGLFGRLNKPSSPLTRNAQTSELLSESYPQPPPDEDDVATMTEATPELSFQETAFEETGLTTTYDLPGLKSLNTSSTASKQRVARVSFTNVAFSHTVVAKYKPVAYLKAKLRNASKLTLLKGPVGLTLDSSFMGRSTLPRCSAGDNFTLSLGVDPAIDVVYPKPDVKRSTSGIFNKEDSSVYTRSVTIANTRASAGKPINLVVLDQVPVSEDERLRIVITYPRGMAVGGNPVSTGVPGKQGAENAAWGKATATLKKAGEVSWDVVLNAGRSVKLPLEYEVAVPGGEGVVQV